MVPLSDADRPPPGEFSDRENQAAIGNDRGLPALTGGEFPPELLAIWQDPEVRRLAVRRAGDWRPAPAPRSSVVPERRHAPESAHAINSCQGVPDAQRNADSTCSPRSRIVRPGSGVTMVTRWPFSARCQAVPPPRQLPPSSSSSTCFPTFASRRMTSSTA